MRKRGYFAAGAALLIAAALTACGARESGDGVTISAQVSEASPSETSSLEQAAETEWEKESADDATGLLQEILDKGVITIGTEGTYSPNSYHDESGKLVGYDVEVGEKVAEKLGVRAEFVETKWDALFASMDARRIDIIVNEVEASEERRLKYDFSEPYTYIHGALLVTEDNEEVQGFEDLKGKRAAQNLTSSWGQMAESYGAELVGVESMNQSVELMLAGRADVTLNAETAFYDYMRNQPDQKVKIVAMTDSTTSSVIPVRKGEEALLDAINQALSELKDSGELAELSEKYFGADVTQE